MASTWLAATSCLAQEQPAQAEEEAQVELSITEHGAVRFTPEDPSSEIAPQRLELQLSGSGGPLDFAIAQRASLGSNADGDVVLHQRGSEVRVGRGLLRQRETGGASTYVFVASDDEALTWQPGSRSEFGGQGNRLALESRTNVGDLSAGVTYERDGVQASLAYVEREASTRVGQQSFSQDESFTGVTVTMRR